MTRSVRTGPSTKTHGRYALTRPPRNDDELYDLTRALWGITIPRDKHCPHHQAPFDAYATAFFARAPQVLVKGSRGLSGKSQLMSILGLTQAVVWGADNNIVGGSENQSRNVIEHMGRAWEFEGAPNQMIVSNNVTSVLLTNKSRIQALTASQKSVRGPHPARLLLDEIDEMDAEILESAKGQPMPQKNYIGVVIPQQTLMVSTLQYAAGTMQQEIKRFKEEGLPYYEWCFLDTMHAKDGWLSEEFVMQKRQEVSKARWEVEYELGEPSIGNRAFDSESVQRMFDVAAPSAVKQSREYEEYRILRPDYNRDYVIAADWAKEKDWTVITVWDCSELPIRLAYYVRCQRRSWPFMVGLFNRLMTDYNAVGIHDATGLGNVVSDLIDGDVWNFLMTGRQRDDMLSEFVVAVENDRVRASKIPSFFSSVSYCSVDDMFSRGKDFHLPDEVCSAALAWKAVSDRFPPVVPYGAPKSNDSAVDQAYRNNNQLDFTKFSQYEKPKNSQPEIMPMALAMGGGVVRKTDPDELSLT